MALGPMLILLSWFSCQVIPCQNHPNRPRCRCAAVRTRSRFARATPQSNVALTVIKPFAGSTCRRAISSSAGMGGVSIRRPIPVLACRAWKFERFSGFYPVLGLDCAGWTTSIWPWQQPWLSAGPRPQPCRWPAAHRHSPARSFSSGPSGPLCPPGRILSKVLQGGVWVWAVISSHLRSIPMSDFVKSRYSSARPPACTRQPADLPLHLPHHHQRLFLLFLNLTSAATHFSFHTQPPSRVQPSSLVSAASNGIASSNTLARLLRSSLSCFVYFISFGR